MTLFKVLAQTLSLIPIVSSGFIDCGSVSNVESGMETQAAPNKFETK